MAKCGQSEYEISAFSPFYLFKYNKIFKDFIHMHARCH